MTVAPDRSKATSEREHLIVAHDEEVIVERYLENWLALVLFWALALIVFLQFFSRYVLNDSYAWTEEIARYGLMALAFIGGAVVTRKKAQIAVELVSNVMKPGLARVTLLAVVDFVTLGFLVLLAYFSVTIAERMHYQRMTVFELPMSIVYAAIGVGCFLMLYRQMRVVWDNMRNRWRKPHDLTGQISAD